MKNLYKNYKGITLIALIITIIVLLILAGVTIAAITGNESAPNKAVEARQANEVGAAKDAATLLVANKIQSYYEEKYVDRKLDAGTILSYLEDELAANKNVTTDGCNIVVSGGKIRVTKIGKSQAIAQGIVSSEGVITWINPVPITSIGEITTTKPEVQEGKTIVLSVTINEDATDSIIWTSSDDTVATVVSSGQNTAIVTGIKGKVGEEVTITAKNEDNSKNVTIKITVVEAVFKLGQPLEGSALNYGKKVIDYISNAESAQDEIGWRLFYQDTEGNTYLIADTLIEGYNPSSLWGKHTGATVKIEGKELNPLIKGLFSQRSNNSSMKTTSWMTDPEEWSQYTDSNQGINSKASFAIAGPTLEMYVKSYNAVADKDISVNPIAYPTWGTNGYNYTNFTSVKTVANGIYTHPSQTRWLIASPYNISGSYQNTIFSVYGYESHYYIYVCNVYLDSAIRPIVCIPTSDFNATYHLES